MALLCRITLANVNGVTRDSVVNDFDAATVNLALAPDIAHDCEAFYNAVDPGTGDVLAAYINPSISRAANAHKATVYDRTLPAGSPPIYQETWTLGGAGSGAQLPAEVALCVSFKASYGAYLGRQQGRRRGRVYVGPLMANAIDQTAGTNYGRPHPTFLRCLQKCGAKLLSDSTLNAWQWAVYSTVDGVANDVLSGWIDNAWDTQRRRGLASSARTLF